MMVIFVSQCEKKALNRTRRVLDAFADRIGDNTWQTVITQEGLHAVKALLRKTASKNTAVSCHWLRSRERTDLLWIVGNKSKFDFRGIVAVNRTKKNILHQEWENNWQYASSIQIIATIAALLHDIGKSTIGFQNKLKGMLNQGDPYRHEWISLKLFEVLIKDCQTDEQWLSRFCELDKWLSQQVTIDVFKKCEQNTTVIATMPPLAQWVAWLIVTHHRLPPYKSVYYTSNAREKFKRSTLSIKPSINKFYEKQLSAIEHWVKNPQALESKKTAESFWQFEQLVIHSPTWQKVIRRWSNKALKDPVLQQISQQSTANKQAICDPFLLYLSRLCLMVGDHNYSNLKKENTHRVKGDKDFKHLAANTDRETKSTNQTLDEHLIGVGALCAKFARKLPVIANALPRIKEQQSLAKNTVSPRFKWQNKAFQLAQSLQKETQTHGFFGVNLASTGCGKTIGNARIMYGLADPKKGARFTIALGLRILTLQTGQSFRENLGFTAQQLAILVGGQANKKLFEMNNEEIVAEQPPEQYTPTFGSESSEQPVDEWLDTQIDYRDYDELNLDTVIENPKARDLLFSPVVTCTVDHLIQASECKRGGKYIAPMLRLLSSDLILDEPDDFDKADLPALSRLVHLAGLFGSRVLLSSATLTPDLVTGLFNAYQAGRAIYNQSQNKPAASIVCAWFDEQEKAITASQCSNSSAFINAHQNFVNKRSKFLMQQTVRRKAEVLPLILTYQHDKKDQFYAQLGQKIINGAIALHHDHHQVDPQSNKHLSVGLVRIANIKNIVQIVMQLFSQANVPENVHIHLSCYHSRQLLILRNSLESKLDRILSRDTKNPDALFSHSEVKNALQKSPAQHHVFIVLATPVAEVGRDHDYDWAIVEPSSMRSIIQLAGRVWRHRPEKIAEKPNMQILQYNLRYFMGKPNHAIFSHPGFEDQQFKPTSYDANQLITPAQLQHIDARARIIKPTHNNIDTLSDLEHQVMENLLNNSKLNYVNAYWNESATANKVHTHLQQISPFRASKPQEDFILIPSEENNSGYDAYYAEAIYSKASASPSKQNKMFQPLIHSFTHPQISPWLVTGLQEALYEVQQKQSEQNIRQLALRFATVSLEERESWQFSEYIGFV